jgi:hypothetical protein
VSERSVDEEQVRREQLADVDVRLQWAYLVAVLVGGTVLMIGIIALLGALA